MARTLKALKDFKEIYDQFDGEIIAVATAAVRQATNQRDFLERVEQEVGLTIQVISGKREAYLDYLGFPGPYHWKTGSSLIPVGPQWN